MGQSMAVKSAASTIACRLHPIAHAVNRQSTIMSSIRGFNPLRNDRGDSQLCGVYCLYLEGPLWLPDIPGSKLALGFLGMYS